MSLTAKAIGYGFGILGIAGGIAGGIAESSDKHTIGTGAAIGATVGIASPLLIKPAIAGAGMIGNGMVRAGSLGINAGSLAFQGMGKTIGAGAKIVQSMGNVLMDGVASNDTAMGRFANKATNPIGRYASATKNVAKNLIKYTPETKVWSEAEKKLVTSQEGKWSLTKTGSAIKSTALIASGFMSAKKAFEESRMGVTDDNVTKATPSYSDNGGASGDLVFALNKNRRG